MGGFGCSAAAVETRPPPPGRWANRYPYTGKMWVDVDPPGAPSRWVTLRACRVLRAVS